MSVMTDEIMIHATAEVFDTAAVGAGTRIWHQAQVLSGAMIGCNCTLGKGAFVGTGSRIGDLTKLGNYASVFGATIEAEVFIGPQACLLEDQYPRATNLNGTRKGPGDFSTAPVTIRRGATVGAAAVVLPGVTVGSYAMIAAGAIVHKDVPSQAMVAGNPARQIGYVCRCGQGLDQQLACACGQRYALLAGELTASTN